MDTPYKNKNGENNQITGTRSGRTGFACCHQGYKRIMKNEGQPDRIVVSLGRKLSITRYENLDCYISYSCDKPPKIAPGKAIQAVQKLVIAEFDRLVQLVRDGKVKGAIEPEERG